MRLCISYFPQIILSKRYGIKTAFYAVRSKHTPHMEERNLKRSIEIFVNRRIEDFFIHCMDGEVLTSFRNKCDVERLDFN